jgi:hypothetical protein
MQTVVRFQVASSIQVTLNDALPGAAQLVLVLLGCLWLEFAVRAGGLSGVALLRDIAVIQLGQTVMALAGGFEGAGAGAGAGAGWGPAGAEASLFLLRTCLLCGPPFAYGVLAGLGMQAPVAEYVRNAVTAYQYRYSAAASAVLRRLDVGVAPVLLGVAAARVGAGWLPHEGSSSMKKDHQAPEGPAAPEGPKLLALVQGALHLVLVDLLLFDLRGAGAAAGVPVQLALSALALVALDALAAVLAHEAAGVQTALAEARGFALWRVSQLLVQVDTANVDALLASAGAVLLVAGRSAGALAGGPAQKGWGPKGAPAGAGPAGPSLVGTLSEVALLASIQTLLAPATAGGGASPAPPVRRVLYIATAAGCVERALAAAPAGTSKSIT